MTRHRRRIRTAYYVYLASHGEPPSVDDMVRLTGYPRGTVYAVLWRLGLIR